jgi:hypothetical protein
VLAHKIKLDGSQGVVPVISGANVAESVVASVMAEAGAEPA